MTTKSKSFFLRAAMTLLVMLLTTVSAWATDDSGSCGTNVTYTYVESTHTLTISYSGSGTGAMADYDLEGAPWYSYCSIITTVIIGSGVTSIGSNAFVFCDGLTSVTIPNSVTSIGIRAFEGCSDLSSIEIPANVTSIGGEAFSYSGLASIEIPASVESIDYEAFYGCRSLTSVTLKRDTPPSLGSSAFDDCTALNAIYVPSSGVEAYKNATDWSAYEDKMQGYDGTCGDNVYYLYNSTTHTLNIFGTGAMADYPNDPEEFPWKDYRGDITTVVIGNGVTHIGNNAFNGCTGLTSITFGNSVTSIGYRAFFNCSALTSVTFGNSVTSIGSYAFYGCTSLTSITIPNSVTSIGNWAFANCSNLASMTVDAGNTVYDSRNGCNAIIETATNTLIAGCKNTVIPNTVTSIGDDAFYGCTGLTSITIPANVTSIGNDAFWYCTGLASIEIPASVTSIGVQAFIGCSGLESISVAGGNTVYDSRNGCNAIIETASNTLIQGCKNTVIPDGVTSIGNDAFFGCGSLTSITIPNSVTSIGGYAFQGCSSLTNIEIPASVTSIGEWAFYACSNLSSVTIYATTPPTLGRLAFDYNASGRKIYVYSDCVDTYKAGWSAYASDIEAMALVASGNCGTVGHEEDVTWRLEGTTGFYKLFISGTGAMENYSVSNMPWYSYKADITTVIIGNGVTSIGNGAFAGCEALTSITIPNSVTSIGESAFALCTALTSIEIPTSVTSIGSYAFNNCTALTGIEIPASVTSIGDDAFLFCLNLESVTIYAPELTEYGSDAFYENASGRKIYVYSDCVDTYKDGWSDYADDIEAMTNPHGTCGASGHESDLRWVLTGTSPNYTLNIFGTGAMADYNDYSNQAPWSSCKADIKTVIIEDGVRSIGNFAFYECTSLSSITIPASVTSIGESAFERCTALTGIEIPTSVTSIGNFAFIGCSGLTSVTIYAPGLDNYGDLAFDDNASGRKIYVFSDCLTAYKTGWSGYASDILPISDGTCGTGVYYSYDSNRKTLNIFGTGAMEDYGAIYQPWYSNLGEIKTVIIEDGVTSIGDWAFNECTSLSSITIPNSVTSIGNSAFKGCSALSSINIPTSVTSIGDWAFQNCTALASILVADGNTVYDSRNNCNAIIETETNTLIKGCKNTIIPASVTSIGEEAFNSCSALTSIEIPTSVTSIGERAFAGCTALASILVADGNTVYDSRNNCNALIETATNTLILGCKNTIIPNDVTSIGNYAFYNCTSLSSITIPNSVTSIGNQAFYGCKALTSIEIPASVTSIGNLAFSLCFDLTSVTIYAPELDNYGSHAFRYNADGRKIYVYSDCVDTYKAGWSAYASDILPIKDITLAANEVDGNYWTTFYCGHTGYEIVDDENACAYTAEYDDVNSELTLHKLGKVIPKNTAVIIVGEDNSISMTASDEGVDVPANDLQGCDMRTLKSELGEGTFYVLGKVSGDFGFFKYTGDYMPASKAYLLIDGDALSARGIRINFGEVNSIHNAECIMHNYAGANTWHDLQGRKLSAKPTAPGIYINNGKLVVVE